MATKPKARGSGAKKKAPKESQKEQSERFIAAARELEADESGKAFEKAIKRIVRPR
jgi:hypothetical protein